MSKGKQNESYLQDSGVQGQYKNWFLDYASYVILERAVPATMYPPSVVCWMA